VAKIIPPPYVDGNEMVHIRTLKQADKSAILTLGRRIFREEDEIPLLQKALVVCIPALSSVAVDDTKHIIGFCLVGQKPTYLYSPYLSKIKDSYELSFFGISPQHQGQGIGTRLLKESLQHCFQRSHQFTLWLIVDVNNVSAIKMYQKWGFRYWFNSPETDLVPGWIMGLSHRRYQPPPISYDTELLMG
jgi:ribosomal protein S18 acetylase RimI-like enzyme